jgi:hypothetical protein
MEEIRKGKGCEYCNQTGMSIARDHEDCEIEVPCSYCFEGGEERETDLCPDGVRETARPES